MHPEILDYAKSLGHTVFLSGEYNINIIGIRSAHHEPNRFDDTIHCVYKDEDGDWIEKAWPCTTEPGKYWLENPTNVNGTAILVPGQYRSTYMLDLHAGKYEALCQRAGAVKVWRDNNKDAILDLDVSTQTGYFGINIHASANDPYNENRNRDADDQVGKWSAGCQVHGTTKGFCEMMDLVHKQIETHPTWAKKFTYTLLEQWW